MLITREVILSCIPTNKKRFGDLGLKWEYKKKIKVPVELLTNKSSAKVWVLCDYCKKEKRLKRYASYTRDRKTIAKDCCNTKNCMNKKREEVNIKKYGVKNPFQLKEVVENITQMKRTPYETVYKAYERMNYRLVTTDYVNNDQKLYFICNDHEELGEQPSRYSGIRDGFVACKRCDSENKSRRVCGEKNGNWKGGTREIFTHLRDVIGDWKRESWLSCNGACIVTGNKNRNSLTVHHLISFKSIVIEALTNLNLELRKQVGDYNMKEIELVENEVVKLHEKYPLGVLIDKEIHKHYHSIFNDENITIATFNKYLLDYHSINSFDNFASQKKRVMYFPSKTGKITFNGVTYVEKQKNKFVATIKIHGKTKYIGSFETEVEAAYFYNVSLKEYRGSNTTINYLNKSQINFVEERIKAGFYKKKKKSSFKHVSQRGNRWEASFRYKNNYYYVGSFATEEEAAKQYNKFIKHKNIKKETLNIDSGAS